MALGFHCFALLFLSSYISESVIYSSIWREYTNKRTTLNWRNELDSGGKLRVVLDTRQDSPATAFGNLYTCRHSATLNQANLLLIQFNSSKKENRLYLTTAKNMAFSTALVRFPIDLLFRFICWKTVPKDTYRPKWLHHSFPGMHQACFYRSFYLSFGLAKGERCRRGEPVPCHFLVFWKPLRRMPC